MREGLIACLVLTPRQHRLVLVSLCAPPTPQTSADAMAPLRAALLAASAAAACGAGGISGRALLLAKDNDTWVGSSAIALQSDADPVFMFSTWVYDPIELVAFRTAASNATPSWRVDTTRDLKYQTLYVSSSGRPAKSGAAVDSLAFWNRKPSGINGDCHLFGFNSRAAPNLDFPPPSAGSWHVNLTADGSCDNINGAFPYSRFALSGDGASATAWVQDGTGNIKVFGIDGQSGAVRWTTERTCGSNCDYFLSYGSTISEDGKWVAFDYGVIGFPHNITVVSSADGKQRGSKNVPSFDGTPAYISPDGSFVFTANDPRNPSRGTFMTWHWSDASGEYLPYSYGQPPVDSGGAGWVVAQAAFSLDAATGTTYLGVVFFTQTLAGPNVLAIYDAARLGQGAISSVVVKGSGSDIALADAVIDCDGALCAAGFDTQRVGDKTQPTLVAVSAAAANASWTWVGPGSVDDVSVVVHNAGAAGEGYYVLAGGCSSRGGCDGKGGFTAAFDLKVAA